MENQPEEPTTVTIDDLIAQVGRQQNPKPMLCTGWVLVCEWFDGEGYSIGTYTDEESPEWRHSGLLTWAANNFEGEWEDADDQQEAEDE